MGKVAIADMGVEGGGMTIYGRLVEGVWSFWREGTSMYLDENDDENWRSWSSDPVPELSLALPEEWWMMYPSWVNPEFIALLRSEYERGTNGEGGPGLRNQNHRWAEVLVGTR